MARLQGLLSNAHDDVVLAHVLLTDSKLRRNGAVQELVDAFRAARPKALELARRGAAGDETGSSGERRTTKRGKNNKKRKLQENKDSEDEGEEGEEETATRPARKTRSQPRRSATSSQTPEIIDLDNDDGSDFVAELEEGEIQPNDGMVACPMCNKRMKEEAVFSHLDRCEGPDKESGSSRSTRTRQHRTVASSHPLQQRSRNGPVSTKNQEPLARLPQLNYSILKDQALRKKLADLGIPNSGNRAQQIKRHTEWVNLWNANVDSLRPRTKRELLSELDKWERSQNMESGGGSIIGGGNGAQVMKKDFDGEGWAKNNKSHFDELIASARAKRSVPKADSGAKEEEISQPPETNGTAPSEDTTKVLEGDWEPHPYDENQEALGKVRRRVDDAARGAPSLAHRNSNSMEEAGDHSSDDTSAPDTTQTPRIPSQTVTSPPNKRRKQSIPSSLPEHLASHPKDVRKMHMFEVPSEPVMDVDTGDGK
ncbi:E3 ubiquitin-protein ligase rad18 [Botryosphaeria dothidea]